MKNRGLSGLAVLLKSLRVESELLLQLNRQFVFLSFRKVIEVSKDPVLHFLRGLVGECHRKNMFEVVGLIAKGEFEKLFGKRTGFPASCRASVNGKYLILGFDQEASLIRNRDKLCPCLYEPH